MPSDWIVALPDEPLADNIVNMVLWEDFGELFAVSQNGEALVWDGLSSTWFPVGPSIIGMVGLLAYEPNLGAIYSVGNVNRIYQNNYEDWIQRTSTAIVGGGFRDLIAYNGNLYSGEGSLYKFEVVNEFTVNEGVLVAPAPVGTSDPRIGKMCLYNNNIFMGSVSGDLFRFTGTNWLKVAPFHSGEDIVADMIVHAGSLYVLYENSGKLLKWNNVDSFEWMNYNEGSRYSLSLVSFGGSIYRGCGNIGGSGLWKFNPLTAVFDQVQNDSIDLTHIASLIVYNNKIYAGGI